MANTGNTFPTSGTTVARGSGLDWTNPGNVVSDNTTDATCAATDANGSDYLVAKTFGFSIPAGATIKGVLVRVEASEHTSGTEPLRAQLQNESGTLFGSEKTTSNEGSISGTTKAVYTYGSTSDLWGATLTPAIVNDPDFGVRFYFSTAHDIRIDYVTMAIQYTFDYTLAGAVPVALAVVAAMTFSNTQAIAGNVPVTVGVAGAMAFTQHPAFVGSVPIAVTPAAAMLYESSGGAFTIVGDVPVATAVAGGMQYNQHPVLAGDLTVAVLPAAGLDYTNDLTFTGDTPITVAVAGAFAHNYHRSLVGQVTISVRVAGLMRGPFAGLPFSASARARARRAGRV